jgi:hypothetical protein
MLLFKEWVNEDTRCCGFIVLFVLLYDSTAAIEHQTSCALPKLA